MKTCLGFRQSWSGGWHFTSLTVFMADLVFQNDIDVSADFPLFTLPGHGFRCTYGALGGGIRRTGRCAHAGQRRTPFFESSFQGNPPFGSFVFLDFFVLDLSGLVHLLFINVIDINGNFSHFGQ